MPAPKFVCPRTFETEIPRRENFLLWLERKTPVWLPDHINDICPIQAPVVNEKPMGRDGNDWFGCHWTWDAAAFAPVVTPGRPLLEDICDWKKVVQFPDLDAIDWAREAAREDPTARQGRPVVFRSTEGPFERLHHVLGFEGALTALLVEPEACFEFMDAVADYKIALFKKILQHFGPVDLFRCNDDWGTQRAGFFSETMFRELILPHSKKIADFVQGEGCFYQQHTCGHQASYMPHSIAAGIRAFELQESANDMEEILRQYGRQASFSMMFQLDFTQRPEATEAEIVREIHAFVDRYAGDGGVAARLCVLDDDLDQRCARELYIYSRAHYARTANRRK